MVDLQMALPPGEKYLNVPPEPIGKGDLLGGEVITVCGDPVIDTIYMVTDHANFFFCLVDARSTQKDNGVIKDDATRQNFIRSEDGLLRGCFDPADKMLFFSLPFIEALMTLVVTIHDTRFSWGQNQVDERPFIPFTVRQKYLLGDAAIEV